MNRRRILQRAAAIGLVSTAGCIGDGISRGATETGTPDQDSCEDETATGPGSVYDSLNLYELPDYVTGYEESVLIRYDNLSSAAQDAVQGALATDGTYEACSRGQEQTTIRALFARIERRWEDVGRDAIRHTYLVYQGKYYGITLVQEGDFIRVDSIPCTSDECPTTPTPPSSAN